MGPPDRRPRIAFFDYPAVFEDFYPAYGVSQRDFAQTWAATGNHLFVAAIQAGVGDATWYEFSLRPELREASHRLGFRVRMLRSPALHRWLWRWFYGSARSWRRQRWWRQYDFVAGLVSLLSLDALAALRRDRPDAVFVQDFVSTRFALITAVARAARRPVVAYHSGSPPSAWRWGPARRWAVRHATRLIVVGEEPTEALEAHGVDAARIVDVPTPMDLDLFRPIPRADACALLGLDEDAHHLLFVGRLDDTVKRVSALIETVGELARHRDDVRLLIAGDGPDRATLEALAQRRTPAGAVRFLGWIDDPQTKVRLMNAADALALPSWREGVPTVVLEALACGTFVVASAVGGVPAVVEDGVDGILVSPGDDDALREALCAAVAGRHDDANRSARRARSVSRVGLASVPQRLADVFRGIGIAATADR